MLQDSAATQLYRVTDLYHTHARRLPVEIRRDLREAIVATVDREPQHSLMLAPLAFGDPDLNIASTSTIDLLAYSLPDDQGRPANLRYVEAAIMQQSASNLGAVFGGLVAFGDRRLSATRQRLLPFITPEILLVAARCTSGYVNHDTMSFWLDLAERLVEDQSHDGLTSFGAIASALAMQANDMKVPIVSDVLRVCPAGINRISVETLAEWTKEEYAS